MNTWIYKCNATRSAGPDSGNWNWVFEHGVALWGFDWLKGVAQVEVGDRIIALQSDRKELVGTATSLGFRRYRGERQLRLRAEELIRAKIPPLKKRDPRIAAIPALQGGFIASVYRIDDQDAELLLEQARRQTVHDRAVASEEISVGTVGRLYPEGSTTRILVNAYERNPLARRQCIRHWGSSCVACGMDFERVYGSRAAGFIHVHHIRPLATIRRTYRVDPIADLRPLCPNCHAVVHRSEPPMPVDDLRKMFAARCNRTDTSGRQANKALQRPDRRPARR